MSDFLHEQENYMTSCATEIKPDKIEDKIENEIKVFKIKNIFTLLICIK